LTFANQKGMTMAATDNEIEVVVFVNETPNAAPPEETITELPIEDNDDDESVVLAPPSSSTTKKKFLIAALASIALVAGVAIGVGTGAKKNTNDVSSISSSKNLVNMENLEKCLQSSEIMKRAIDDEDVTPAPSTYQPSTYTPTSTPVLMSNDVSDLTASSGNEIRRELRGARHGKHMSEKEARRMQEDCIGITDAGFQDKFAGNPFFQALAMPDDATESQSFEDLLEDSLEEENGEEDGLSAQVDLDVDSSVSTEGSIAASPSSGGGSGRSSKSGKSGGIGWSSKSGKGNDCSIEKMRGSYVFKYDLWASFFDFGKRTKVMSKRVVNGLDRTKSMGPVWKTFYLFRDRSVLANFGRPIVPPSLSGFLGRGRGAMEGTLQVIGFPLCGCCPDWRVTERRCPLPDHRPRFPRCFCPGRVQL